MKRVVLAMAMLGTLSACGVIGGGGDKKPKTPVLGNRIPVLNADSDVEIDPALADVNVMLPPPEPNAAWSQPGGNAAKSMGNLALSRSPERVWSVSIGQGSSKRARIGAAPVVSDGKLFAMDAEANIKAFDAQTGRALWSIRFGNKEDERSLFGGGVSAQDGKVYATNGVGEVAAIDASNGNVLWRVKPGGPLRGSPSIGYGNIYVISQDNQIFALEAATGKLAWNEASTLEIAGIFGAAAPAVAQGTVVAGFSSGELTAYRYENGRVLWQDALTRTNMMTTVSALADIDASPVIDGGRVYAIGKGGRMVALEMLTGQRLWEINVAGISTPWVVGDWIYAISDDARLMCINRNSGRIKWISQLPRYKNKKKKANPISWVGPVLAGNRLVLASSDGRLTNVEPLLGTVGATANAKGSIMVQPVVANNMLYILDDEGKLSAWK